MAYQMRLLPDPRPARLYSNLATVKVSHGAWHARLDTPPRYVEGAGATRSNRARRARLRKM